MKKVMAFLIIIAVFISVMPSFAATEITEINQQDFNGDVTFFDNRYCYVGETAAYRRFSPHTGENSEIITKRLINHTSPQREDSIYMKRALNEVCYFNVDTSIPEFANASGFNHKYMKVEGDFRADTLQSIRLNIGVSDTANQSHQLQILINSDGKLWSGSYNSGTSSVTEGEPFKFLWAINSGSFDVYINGTKNLSQIPFDYEISRFTYFQLELVSTSNIAGELCLDNFNVTGLVKPIVDGVETKTPVISDDSHLIDFMSDKTGIHIYGNTLYKDGKKSLLETKGIFNKETEQYYVTADTLNTVFDLDLQEQDGEITGNISVDINGNVTGDKVFELQYQPIVQNNRMYVSIGEFAEKALDKYVWWFKTGILLFTDYQLNIDSSTWEWQSARTEAAKCTVWNDIDCLNGFLQYIRPDENMLSSDYKAQSAHPRLYLTADEFANLKQKYISNTDAVFNKGIDAFIKDADKYIGEGPVTYSAWADSMRHNAGIYMGDRFKAFGIAYYITGDKKYVDAAYAQFEAAAAFPDFNTAHIIDAGESAMSLALGYDWFYNAFTPDQREVALKVVREDCLKTLADGLYGRLTSSSNGAVEWRAFKLKSNYNTIVNSGIILASIATLEYNTDEALSYIKDSLRSVEYSLQMFPPDGAWTEGPAYLEYTLRYLISLSSNLEKNFGTSYNIMEGQGMADISDFMIAINGAGGSNNIGDSDLSKISSYENYFYLGNRYNKPYITYLRQNDLKNGTVPTFYDLMFYDFDANNLDASVLEEVPNMYVASGMELYSIRDTHKDTDFYFSAHFGTSSGNHQHSDCGSFVLDLFGKRWAYDLGKEDYNLQNEEGYQGYEIYRKRGESHNMLVINPTEYSSGFETKSGEFAPIKQAKANSGGGYVVADMSNIYNDASAMTIGYYIDDNMNSLTMRNEFTLTKNSFCIWTMNTKGEINIDGNTAYITQGDDTIKLEVICTGEDIVWADNGNPHPISGTVSETKFANQNQNSEYRQLRLSFNALAGDNKLIIKISPEKSSVSAVQDMEFDRWALPTVNTSTIIKRADSITAKANNENSVFILAVYDETGKMTDVITTDKSGLNELSFAGDYYKTKAFVIENLDDLKPLTKEVTYIQEQE